MRTPTEYALELALREQKRVAGKFEEYRLLVNNFPEYYDESARHNAIKNFYKYSEMEYEIEQTVKHLGGKQNEKI